MSFIPLPPGASLGMATERSDAARNRERLLAAARELIDECGAEGLTMNQLAERAGVGKGTVFRRFGSRAGLMLNLLTESEADFQARFMFGPPPLGPGAPAAERLVAFGVERISYVLQFGDLLLAAEASPHHPLDVPAAVLAQRHLQMLLEAEGIQEESWLLAGSLAATLDPERLLHAVRVHKVAPERLQGSWRQLVARLVRH